jgi:hypothetical protein
MVSIRASCDVPSLAEAERRYLDFFASTSSGQTLIDKWNLLLDNQGITGADYKEKLRNKFK